MSKKSRGSGTGKFILGTFMGFLICLLLIAGVGLFAYYNVSIDWINSTFKTNINAGEDFNGKTPNELISALITFTGNVDGYTINDLKDDFGINLGDKIQGIDITDLKDVEFKNLGNAIENKIKNISADELKDVFDFSSMDKILNKVNTYYINNGSLYSDAQHTKPVGFEYSINSNKVKIKSQEFSMVENKVDIELRYLPLTKAITSFTSSMGDKITVGELEVDYGIKLPIYLRNTDEKRAKTVNELQSIINDVTVAEILGYIKYGNVYKDGETVVTGIMNAIAGKQVDELAGVIDELKLTDVFDANDFTTGALKLISNPETVKISDVSEVLTETIKTKKLWELKDANLITQDVDVEIENSKTSHDGKNLKNLTINEAVVVLIDVLNALKISA